MASGQGDNGDNGKNPPPNHSIKTQSRSQGFSMDRSDQGSSGTGTKCNNDDEDELEAYDDEGDLIDPRSLASRLTRRYSDADDTQSSPNFRKFPLAKGTPEFYDDEGDLIDPRSLASRLTRRYSDPGNGQSSRTHRELPPTEVAPEYLPCDATTTSQQKKRPDSRPLAALKQLFCGGVAGSAAKTVTAPLSRLTILFQVHPMVTTKSNAPAYADGVVSAAQKVFAREGLLGFWRGNGTSVLHRFPYSAINFYVYEGMLDHFRAKRDGRPLPDRRNGKRRMTPQRQQVLPGERFMAGATAGTCACVACYPLDLIRTRFATQLPGREQYRGISDAFATILRTEGVLGLYSGIGTTLFVAVPNFAISYSVYGTLKEYALDDDLFYNLRRVDSNSGETSLGFGATLLCGAASGGLSATVTFPFDTVRRRMQIQSLHVEKSQRSGGLATFIGIAKRDGIRGLYRGIAPELLKVVPMVGTMFLVYERLKDTLVV